MGFQKHNDAWINKPGEVPSFEYAKSSHATEEDQANEGNGAEANEMNVEEEAHAHEMNEETTRTYNTNFALVKGIVFTDPLDVQARSTVTVFYNPSNTNLNGKPEVWFRCSFNRWTHSNGSLPPQRMLATKNGTHVKASVKVPLDAYKMEFVFSESEHGGVFDNKLGMNYHIPVFGGIVKEPPLHIVHIVVEMAPIAKVS
ncbi:hypothetical protein VNO80_30436 [Phaseolus coccineus]|uniref:starch synthase n=1 Tax=Phaseolus coccineus TaxID=3886 RepID=A0AAN9LD68_PHACN